MDSLSLWRAYLRTLLLLSSLVFAGVILINVWIDPYNLFCHSCTIPKPGESKNQRAYKMFDLLRYKPERLLLGTSRVDYGVDGQLFGATPFYNAGLSDATLDEMLSILQAAHIIRPVKEVIVFLDISSFDEERTGTEKFRLSLGDAPARFELARFFVQQAIKATMTLDALIESLEILIRSDDRCIATRIYGRSLAQDKACQEDHSDRFQAFMDSASSLATSTYGRTGSAHLLRGYGSLQKILDYGRKQQLDITLVMAPVHKQVFESAGMSSENTAYLAWQQQVHKIVSQSRAQPWLSVLHFSDLTSLPDVTNERVSQRMRYWWEASHFKPAVGLLLMQSLAQKAAYE